MSHKNRKNYKENDKENNKEKRSSKLRKYGAVYNEYIKKTKTNHNITSERKCKKDIEKSLESEKIIRQQKYKTNLSQKQNDKKMSSKSIEEKINKNSKTKSSIKKKKIPSFSESKQDTKENKNKQPITEYQKFFIYESKKSKYKNMLPNDRMKQIGELWSKTKNKHKNGIVYR